MLGSLGQNLIYLIDTSFIGRVGEIELGAAAIGGIFYFVLFMVGYGLNTGMQVIVARRKGEGADAAIGEVVDHELIMILLLALTQFSIMYFFSDKLLYFFVQSSLVHEKTSEFLHYRSFGIFFSLINSCLMAFFVGIGNTRVTTWTTGVLCFVNIILDYLLIFGKFNFPKMGIAGAGLASSISEATVTLVIIFYLYRKNFVKLFSLFHFRKMKRALTVKMLSVSSPLVFQQLISVGTWFLFFIVIEHLGERELAISNLVRSLYTFFGIPVWALASTTNSMTSNLLGQGKQEKVIPLIKKIASVSIVFSLVFAALVNIFPASVLSIYTNEKDLIIASIPSLRSVTVAITLFSVAVLTIFAVSGTGATRVSLLIEVACIIVYVIYVYLVAEVFHMSLPVIWLAETVYWVCALLFCSYYLIYGKWSMKKV